jgi:hypothetical protein
MARQGQQARRGVRPVVEPLEDRTLPTNLIFLDFTPDKVPGEARRPDSFISGFHLRGPHGHTPTFLDFNHDGKVNGADAVLAYQDILVDMAHYYAGFDAIVTGGDLGRNTQLGWDWHLMGQTVPDLHVYVMYVGGMSFDGDIGTFGESYQAPPGFNLEWYAFDFSSSMIRWYMQNNPTAAPEQFAQDVALTAAHETGHMLGLGHVFANPPGDTNIMNYNADPATANIPDRVYPLIELRDINLNPVWGPQNPAQEVRDSLAGQPAYPTAGLTYTTGGGGSAPKRGGLERTSAAEVVGPVPHHHAGAAFAGAGHHSQAWADAVEALFAAA